MSIGTVVLVAAVKGSVLLLAAWLIMRAYPRMSAALRHLVWASALGGLLLMPLLVRLVPRFESRFVPSLPAVTAIQTVDALEPAAPTSNAESSVDQTVLARTELVESAVPPHAASARSIDLRWWFPAVWLGVGALLLFRVIFGRLRLSLLARRASVVDDGDWLLLTQRLAQRLDIRRPVTLLRSSRSCVPMTWGLVYPTVMLPAESFDWPIERRTIVLLHELAHVNRFDAFTQSVAQVATAIFWFNPLVWLAARAMRVERELACDDCVLASGARPSDYAQDLLQIARSFARTSDLAAAALAMARRGDLEDRLLAILDPTADRRVVSGRRMFAAAAAIVLLALPLAALAPAPVEAATAATQSTQSTERAAPAPVPQSRAGAPAPASRSAAPVSRSSSGITRILMTPFAAGPQVLTSRPSQSIPSWNVRPADLPAAAPTARAEAPDRETLLSVARAALKLNSSYDKAELLVPIAKYYAADAELSKAYLDAAASITADYDCARTFTAFFSSNPITDDAVELAMGVAATRLTSDYEKANVILAAVGKGRTIGPDARTSVIRAIASIRSDYDKHRAITGLVTRSPFNDRDAAELIKVASTMRASYDKAQTLIEIAERYPDMSGAVRQAYVQATESIKSAYDYRRAVEALVKHP
jgi:beta-lactamase regulating signal transducer with metallopeptidase domain